MSAEQEVVGLHETKVRVEMLISYYRELGEKEVAFVELLEDRLEGVTNALRRHSGPVIC